MNKNLEEKYRNVIEDNVNVGKSNIATEFLILVAGFFGLCFLIYIFADSISCFALDRISNETQVKIEKSFTSYKFKHDDEQSEKIQQLEKIKQQIVALDKNLQNKSKLNIYEYDSNEINAFIVPNGTIYFTKGLLNQVDDEEILAFVLAHELGHYAHKDHLKSMSREIIASILLSALSAGQQSTNITTGAAANFGSIKYSQKQETNADLYANKMVYTLYGNNNGAVKFFKMLDEKENMPEFLYYFSTHPSTKDRLKTITKK